MRKELWLVLVVVLLLLASVAPAAGAKKKTKNKGQKKKTTRKLSPVPVPKEKEAELTEVAAAKTTFIASGTVLGLSNEPVAHMQNDPRQQPAVPFDELVARVKKEREISAKIAKKGVAGKYQAKREAEVVGCETRLRILQDELGSGDVGFCDEGRGQKK